MIHKVRKYSATLTSRDEGEVGFQVSYRPLVERLATTWGELDEVIRAARLVFKHNGKVLVVIFEPERKTLLKHDMVISSTYGGDNGDA